MGITMRWLLIAVALNFCYSTLKVDGHRASSNAPVMMQMPVQGNRPLVNPTVCVGITAFIVGTAIGIGIGVLISNNTEAWVEVFGLEGEDADLWSTKTLTKKTKNRRPSKSLKTSTMVQ